MCVFVCVSVCACVRACVCVALFLSKRFLIILVSRPTRLHARKESCSYLQ